MKATIIDDSFGLRDDPELLNMSAVYVIIAEVPENWFKNKGSSVRPWLPAETVGVVAPPSRFRGCFEALVEIFELTGDQEFHFLKMFFIFSEF